MEKIDKEIYTQDLKSIRTLLKLCLYLSDKFKIIIDNNNQLIDDNTNVLNEITMLQNEVAQNLEKINQYEEATNNKFNDIDNTLLNVGNQFNYVGSFTYGSNEYKKGDVLHDSTSGENILFQCVADINNTSIPPAYDNTHFERIGLYAESVPHLTINHFVTVAFGYGEIYFVYTTENMNEFITKSNFFSVMSEKKLICTGHSEGNENMINWFSITNTQDKQSINLNGFTLMMNGSTAILNPYTKEVLASDIIGVYDKIFE